MALERDDPRRLKEYLEKLNKLTPEDMKSFTGMLDDFHEKLKTLDPEGKEKWELNQLNEEERLEKSNINPAEEMQSRGIEKIKEEYKRKRLAIQNKYGEKRNKLFIDEVFNKQNLGDIVLSDFILCYLNAKAEADSKKIE